MSHHRPRSVPASMPATRQYARLVADGFYASIWQFSLVAVAFACIAAVVYGGYHVTWTAPAAPSYHAHATTPH